MKQIALAAMVALSGVLLAGCESPGRSLAKSAVEQIRDGQTTRAEIEKIFGEPLQMTKSPAGRTLYLYQRFYGPDMPSRTSIASPRRDESNLFVLSVLFSPADIVEKHLYSHTQPDIDRMRLSAGRKLSSEHLAKIQPQKTTRAELTTWFGPPVTEFLTLDGRKQVNWEYVDAYNIGGRMEVQVLEAIVGESGTVLSFRVTKRDPWRN